jgi:plastocyanin
MSHITRRTVLALTAVAPVAIATAAQAGSHASAEVVIENFKFTPASLQVQAGQAVRFVNTDGANHTATSDGGAFDTGTLGRGGSIEVEIPAGQHTYACRFHPKMKGTIVAT